MKVYDKEGRSMNAAADQLPILEAHGWSRTKPEVKEELVPESDSASEPKEVAEQVSAPVQVSKPKPKPKPKPAKKIGKAKVKIKPKKIPVKK